MLDKQKNRALEKGTEWNPDQEEYKVAKELSTAMINGQEVAIRGPMLQEAIAKQVGGLDANYTAVDKDAWIREVLDVAEYFKPKWVKQPSPEMYRQTGARYLVKQSDGWEQCILCFRCADDQHKASDEHKRRVSETAAGDQLIGWCLSSRRFTKPHAGMTDLPTLDNGKRFWGKFLDDNMPRLVWDKLGKGCSLEAKIGKGVFGTRRLSAEDVLEISLAMVTYKGDGKYDHTVDFGVTLHTMQLIDPVDPPKELELPTGRSWWPVCWVQWKTEVYDNWYGDQVEQYRTHQLSGATVVWVVCWYQLFDSDWVMTLWPVRLRQLTLRAEPPLRPER